MMSNTIRTVVSPVTDVEEKGMFGGAASHFVADVDLDSLKASLGKLTRDLGELFAAQATDSSFSLKQIEVGVEITAEGGINLIGTLTAGAKASITLTFEKP
jgi:hypothetical protein